MASCIIIFGEQIRPQIFDSSNSVQNYTTLHFCVNVNFPVFCKICRSPFSKGKLLEN